MPKGFTLAVNPVVYYARYLREGNWEERFLTQPHLSSEEEEALPEEKRDEYYHKRNAIEGMPLVNYTTQYGLGCFEGLKAFPQKDGAVKLFRPQENAQRMANSMEGLKMPVYPVEMFVEAVRKVVADNVKLGFTPQYENPWEEKDYILGQSIYIRPFTYAESGIGLNLSYFPYVIVVTTNVGAYFMPGNAKAITTDKVRAFPGGTGWIKCNANYVTPILVKKQAITDGYMEAIFLDAQEHRYIEEGSSCNIFFLLKNGTLVTPNLNDTILPGITRSSILTLAQDLGVSTEERKITIDEVFADAVEVFVTGTAAGISYIESIDHMGKSKVFCDGRQGDLTHTLLRTLKGIQYGALADKHGWMVKA